MTVYYHNDMKIKQIIAREILDSRDDPTVEVKVILKNGVWAKAGVPSGASTGKHEALELRDGNPKRYGGKGVLKAVRNVNEIIAPKLRGLRIADQRAIDKLLIELDGTPNKSKLGANAILGVSLACARAAATGFNLPLYVYLRRAYWQIHGPQYRLPQPMMNLINGGAHADFCQSIQEFMILPQQSSAAEQVRCGAEVFDALHDILKKNKQVTAVGDEGGFAPRVKAATETFDMMIAAIKAAGYTAGKNVKLAIDAAASEFYKRGRYTLDGQERTADELVAIYGEWLQRYPIISIEDGLAEDDWKNWAVMTKKLGKKTMLVGDDLFVTNVERLKKGIGLGVANAVLIKVNQIGSLSETIDCIALARHHGYKVAISHRSGETPDSFIVDLAVAANAEYLKAGSLSRGERVAKYNRLMEIEDELKRS